MFEPAITIMGKYQLKELTASRLKREQKTIVAMLEIYCKHHHKDTWNGSLCVDCQNLLDYSNARLFSCPFQEKKPTCAKCLIHCYKHNMRQKIQEVMIFSGPKMVLRHPVLAILHLLDGKKQIPSFKNTRS